MKRCDFVINNNLISIRLSRSLAYFFVLSFVLLFPVTVVLASHQSSISDIQGLLNLANSSLVRGDLNSSIDSLDEALNIIQKLKEDEGVADVDTDDFPNDLEGEDDRSNNDNDAFGDGNEIGDTRENLVDDNVERSQRCVENAKPGEVCALS